MARTSKLGCKIPGCGAGHRRNGFCARHDAQFKSGAIDVEGRVLRDLRPVVSPDHPLYTPREVKTCKMVGCGVEATGRGFCQSHYYHFRTGKLTESGEWLKRPREGAYKQDVAPCRVTGCGRPVRGNALCSRHYQQVKNGIIDAEGAPLRDLKIGRGKAKYEGRYTDCQGYVHVLLPEHPMANSEGYVLEHRLVVATLLGRCLTEQEIVHHKNGQRADNASENLELMRRIDHFPGHSVYAEDVIAYAADLLQINGTRDMAALQEAVNRLNYIALTMQI